MAHFEEKTEPWEKPLLLDEAVMTQTPDEVAEFYRLLGEVEFTANALGCACRYRGLEMVKVLVEGGAKFSYGPEKMSRLCNYPPLLEEGVNHALMLLSKLSVFNSVGRFYDRRYADKILPLKERLAIADYLCETADKTDLDKDGLLFYAYFADKSDIRDHLKENGAKIPETWIKIVTEGGRDKCSKEKWFDYCYLIDMPFDDEFMPCMSAFISELDGKKLYFTESLWINMLKKRCGIPGFYKFFFENFDLSKVSKGKIMRSIIENNCVDGLVSAADLGWLNQPKKRDEMIAYSAEKGKTECTAWLLDLKNRTADLAAERERAEKKQERELNAAPDSVTVQKQFWSFKKKEDGTIIITGYKGDKTEITIPEKIGKSIVTEIGERAFSPNALRITEEQAVVRCRITKITVPPGVKVIGAEAFGGAGVCKGNFNAFSLLEEVVLPENLEFFANKEAAENAPRIFVNCPRLTVKIPHSPYAEIFCRKNKVNYIFTEEI